jgi:hypothetical protein
MAFVSGIFDKISGRVGDVVYRHKNGKTYVARRPKKRSTEKSTYEKALQKKFGLSGQIARSINSIEALKYFWKLVTARNHAPYNRIFKENYRQIKVEDLSGFAQITPIGGFDLTEGSLKLNESDIVIQCKALGKQSVFNTIIEKYIIAAGIIILKDPKIENIPSFEVIPFETKKNLLYPGDYLSLSLELKGSILGLYESYSIKTAAAVFITLDEEGKPMQYSTSILS